MMLGWENSSLYIRSTVCASILRSTIYILIRKFLYAHHLGMLSKIGQISTNKKLQLEPEMAE